MASTSGVAEAATKSLLMSIRRSLIHCSSMYVNNIGLTASIDGSREDVGQPRCNLKSTPPARKIGPLSHAGAYENLDGSRASRRSAVRPKSRLSAVDVSALSDARKLEARGETSV